MRDLMIDLETMGLSPDGAIISIGALYFDLRSGETGDGFEVPVDLESSVAAGMKIYPSTVLLWLGQSTEAVDGWRNSDAVSIQTALNEFIGWITRHATSGSRTRVWANAPTFDLDILRTAFGLLSLPVPWHFKQERCVRTIADLGRDMGMTGGQKVPRVGTAHKALDDCQNQVRYCHEAWKALVNV